MTAANHLPPQWRERLLALLAAKVNGANLLLLAAWAQVEGGVAVENPLNTTYGLAGSTPLEGNTAGVRNYRSDADPRPVEGIGATAFTLAAKYRAADGTLRLRYRGILNDLQQGTKNADQIVEDNRGEFESWAGGSTDYPDKILQQIRSTWGAESRGIESDAPNYAELFKDDAGQWRFRLKSGANHKTIAQSEGYKRRKDAVDTLSRYFGGYEF